MPNEEQNAHIQCHLFDYPLRDSSAGTHLYEALSYVWGDESIRTSIRIGKQDSEVTLNLHAALLHLRDRLLERVIWVDAICINQEDSKEKSHQVQLMAEIYAKASRVIVWLGEATDKTDQTFERIRIAATGQLTESSSNETSQEAILTLLQRPWFERIWVREYGFNNMGRHY